MKLLVSDFDDTFYTDDINILKNNLKAIGYIIVCIINFNNISY